MGITHAPEDVLGFAASDDLIYADDAETAQITSGSTFTKVKEIDITLRLATSKFRMKFDIMSSDGDTVWGKITLNGSSIGSAQTTTVQAYTTKSQDIEISTRKSDKLQLYIRNYTSAWVKARNFRIYGVQSPFKYKAV